MQIYLVGGAVRDELLGLPVKDRDFVVVNSSPEALLALGYKSVGKDFPVFLHPKTHEEYALARTERKTGRGYHAFEFQFQPTVTLAEDLQRRDLTINAIAKDEETGALVDPYGGVADIQQKLLRHVSPAFIEDPVRLLRVAKFAARFFEQGFAIADETRELLKQMVHNGEIDSLVPERVWQEIASALSGANPQVFFQTLHNLGALRVLLPELAALDGVPNPAQHHPEIDSLVHTLMVVEQAAKLSELAEVRFAALMHDLGKALTPEKYWPKHHGHEEAGVKVLQQLCRRLRVPNNFRDLAVLVMRFHGKCHRALELKPATMIKLLEDLGAYHQPERLEWFLLACEADSKGRTGFEDKPYPQADRVRQAFDATQGLSAKAFVEQGLKGAEIGQALHDERVRVWGLAQS